MTDDRYDLVVVGAGSAGLATAIVAHSKGLRVLVVEKTAYVGGTTSFSGGVIWVPNSRQNREMGVEDSVDLATLYLDSVLGNLPEREARIAYLERAPEAIAYLESHSHVEYFVRPSNSPDYCPNLPGAVLRGRALTPVNYDGRRLGEKFHHLRPSLPELSLFGTAMLDGVDLFHFLKARSSARSALHALRFLLRHARDRVFHRSYGRGTRLTGGIALVARLYESVLDRGIPVLRNTPLLDLVMEDGRVRGAVVGGDGGPRRIEAECGVVLATGGFPWGAELRQEHIGEAPLGYSAAAEDNIGDGIRIATARGAQFATSNADGAFWTPVSVGRHADGRVARFPHLMADRSKPGVIAINGAGRRFYNEAENYHAFVRAMLGKGGAENPGPFHLICDHAFVRKYPFGMVAPLSSQRRKHVRSGYLIRARTVADLARRIGVDPLALQKTLERYNRHAATGDDPDFGKGSTAYNRYLGDPAHRPNPCLAPIEQGPFYAIRLYPGDIGTTFGLAVDPDSRVLDRSGRAIEGLYACGNDRNSVMGGLYPSGGITIGPGLTFAYLAALDAARVKAGQGAAAVPLAV